MWIETHFRWFCAKECIVTPFVGVWIETAKLLQMLGYGKSHPSWVCGLKLNNIWTASKHIRVTPFVGVWIETSLSLGLIPKCAVTPFVGVWIETSDYFRNFKYRLSHPSWVCGLKPLRRVLLRLLAASHPSWVCGLKHDLAVRGELWIARHTLRGCVD